MARLSPEDLSEVFSLRRVLERLAVQRACEYVAPDDLDEMQAEIDTMARYIERGITEKEAAELDLRFHDVLYRAGKHRRLYAHWSKLRPQIHIFLLSRNVADPDFRQQTVHGHQDILDAIQARDAARALAVLEDHLEYAYERVLASYQRLIAAGGRSGVSGTSRDDAEE